jgi:hypothetical protein
MNSEIYKLAFEKIRNEPEGLFRGFAKNLGNILSSGPSGIFLGPFRFILLITYVMGFLYCLVSIRHPFSALMVASTLGIFLSSIVILDDGGQRLFAATIAFDAILVGLGVKCITNSFSVYFKNNIWKNQKISVILNEDNESPTLFQHIMGGIQISPLLIPFCGFLISELRPPEFIQTNDSSLTFKTNLREPGILICGLGYAPTNSPPLYSIARLQELLPNNGTWWGDDIARNNGKILVSLPCRVSMGTDHKHSCIQFIADIGMQISTRDKQYITLKKNTDNIFGVKYYIAE